MMQLTAARIIKRARTNQDLKLDRISFNFDNFSTFLKGDYFRFYRCWKLAGIKDQGYIVSYLNSYRLRVIKGDLDYKPSTVESNYIAAYAVLSMDVPDVILQPLTLAERLMNLLFHENIQIEGHPVFNKKYLLQSTDKMRVGKILTSDFIKIFELHDDLHLEIRNNRCLIRFERPIQEDDGVTLIGVLQQLFNINSITIP
jgi:hypothetical protein